MKQLLFILVLSGILLSGCDKAKQTSKFLDGTWKIRSYAKNQNGGFITYFETEGTITFTSNGDGTFDYQENYSYQTDTGVVQSTRSGTGVLKGKKMRSYDLTLTDPITELLIDCQIDVLTRDDLKIKQQDSEAGHIYVLYKD